MGPGTTGIELQTKLWLIYEVKCDWSIRADVTEIISHSGSQNDVSFGRDKQQLRHVYMFTACRHYSDINTLVRATLRKPPN